MAALPAASGQTDPGTFDSAHALAAGETYVDGVTGVRVLKLTDATTPEPNDGIDKGYSEGGPSISLPWTADGHTFHTIRVDHWLVDLREDDLTLSNWRPIEFDGEIGFAFSLNPATPRIAFLVINGDDHRLNRYDTAANQLANTGNWPWIVAAQGDWLDWVQTQVDDRWIVGLLGGTQRVVAWRPSDGVERVFDEANAGVVIDEPHIDRELPLVYLSTDSMNQNVIGELESGQVRVPRDSTLMNDDHNCPLRGGIAGMTHWEQYGAFFYDANADTVTNFTDVHNVIGFPGDWHQAGQWVFGNGAGIGQWWVIDAWGTADADARIQSGMIGIVRGAPFDVRLVAAHHGSGNGYERQPQPTLAPDGRYVMWTSDYDDGDRLDTFLAVMPTL